MVSARRSIRGENRPSTIDWERLVLGALGIFWINTGYFLSITVSTIIGYEIVIPDVANGDYQHALLVSTITIFGAIGFCRFCQWIGRGFVEEKLIRIIVFGILLFVYSTINIIFGINTIKVFDDRIGSTMTIIVIIFTAGVLLYKRGSKILHRGRSRSPKIPHNE
jgi:hypothetical protein